MSINLQSTLKLDKSFNDWVQSELVKYVNLRVKELIKSVEPEIKFTIKSAIFDSEEYRSLTTNGAAAPSLREELGIQYPVENISEIIEAIIAAMRLNAEPPSGDNLGGLYLGVFHEDFSDALSASGASYTSAPSGSEIKWLDWLLTKGSGIIIKGYELLYDYPNRKVNTRKASRTGKAIMVKRDYTNKSRYNAKFNRFGPGQWAVPSQFAGTAENNWFTKIIDKIGPNIQKLIEERAEAIFK